MFCCAIVLFFVNSMLAQGNSVYTNALWFRIGRTTMQSILSEVCEALSDVLAHLYLPQSAEDDWQRISREFEQRWDLPHCVGALDGKHVALKKPPNSGSMFFCYKKFFSMVILAVCDAYRRFIWFNVGHYGKICQP